MANPNPDLPVVIFGAGGHGRVVADAALTAGWKVLGFLDDARKVGTPLPELSILGDSAWLEEREHVAVAVAVALGSNADRSNVFARLDRPGRVFVTVIHPAAVVSRFARIGRGSVVLAAAVVNAGAIVGNGVIINTAAVVEHDVSVGDFAHVSPNATVAGAASIGRGAHIGAGACVLPQRRLGDGCVVGAGSVVTHDIPALAVALGVPARLREGSH